MFSSDLPRPRKRLTDLLYKTALEPSDTDTRLWAQAAKEWELRFKLTPAEVMEREGKVTGVKFYINQLQVCISLRILGRVRMVVLRIEALLHVHELYMYARSSKAWLMIISSYCYHMNGAKEGFCLLFCTFTNYIKFLIEQQGLISIWFEIYRGPLQIGKSFYCWFLKLYTCTCTTWQCVWNYYRKWALEILLCCNLIQSVKKCRIKYSHQMGNLQY